MDVERRFKRELLLARQVTHRNVGPPGSTMGAAGGGSSGIKYLTMHPRGLRVAGGYGIALDPRARGD